MPSYFETDEDARNKLIKEAILPHLETDESGRIIKIVNGYAGVDEAALSILAYAAERGKFDEYAKVLEEHFKNELDTVHPDNLVTKRRKTERFFLECYKELGIEPQFKPVTEEERKLSLEPRLRCTR